MVIISHRNSNIGNNTIQFHQNYQIWAQFNRCLQIEEHNFRETFDIFLKDMLNKHFKTLVECLREIEYNMENNIL